LEQWHKLFKGDELTHKFTQGELIEAYEVPRLKHTIAIYRSSDQIYYRDLSQQ
ncbi:hypothetical protein C8J23_1091, partial [Shewanella chilikensis]